MGKKKKIDDDLYFDDEDVHMFNDYCESLGMEMNLPYTGNSGVDPEDINGVQSYTFGLIDSAKINLWVTFSLSNADDAVTLEWSFDYQCKSKDLERKIDTAIGGGPQFIGEFISDHNNPLEVIRDQTSDVVDLIEDELQEIIDDLKSEGLI